MSHRINLLADEWVYSSELPQKLYRFCAIFMADPGRKCVWGRGLNPQSSRGFAPLIHVRSKHIVNWSYLCGVVDCRHGSCQVVVAVVTVVMTAVSGSGHDGSFKKTSSLRHSNTTHLTPSFASTSTNGFVFIRVIISYAFNCLLHSTIGPAVAFLWGSFSSPIRGLSGLASKRTFYWINWIIRDENAVIKCWFYVRNQQNFSGDWPAFILRPPACMAPHWC